MLKIETVETHGRASQKNYNDAPRASKKNVRTHRVRPYFQIIDKSLRL